MISVSVGVAKNKLPYYLHLVEEKGESIQVTRHGKTVAVINNQEASEVLNKKQMFCNSLLKWRKKCYGDDNSTDSTLLINKEIDDIFLRTKEAEPIVRHSEDFE